MARRGPPSPPTLPPTGRSVAVRALLRPYADGRALPDDEALLARAKSALRQAGEPTSVRAVRALIEDARQEHAAAHPQPAPVSMGMRALLGCHIDVEPSDPQAVRMMLRKEADEERRSARNKA